MKGTDRQISSSPTCTNCSHMAKLRNRSWQVEEVADRYLMCGPQYPIVRDEIKHEIREHGELLMRLSVSISLYNMQVKSPCEQIVIHMS